jgi:hypothetical protein
MSGASMLQTIMEVSTCVALSYTTLSIIEWYVHRNFMHRRTLRSLHRYVPVMKSILYKHAVQHHAIYYKDFRHEPDLAGRYISIYPNYVTTTILACPVVAAFWCINTTFSVVFTAGLLLHHAIWALAHEEMHIPGNAFFQSWAPFKWLARNHWMHHEYRSVNFNFAFPLADHLFGTYRSPDSDDRVKMSEIGL